MPASGQRTEPDRQQPPETTLEHVSLPEAVGQALRRRILNNEIPAETRLVEAKLAAEFGVSRSTIRDAMRTLQAEGLIAIYPRRHRVVTRMSPEDASDICYARYVLEDASLAGGLGEQQGVLHMALEAAMDRMRAAAQANDMDALVQFDSQFHAELVSVSGRRRLKDLWGMLDSQMGAVLRAEIERQGISLTDAADLHRDIFEAASEGNLDRLRAALRLHYTTGLPGTLIRR